MPYQFFKDSNGHSHEVLIQGEWDSCGIACVAMVENLVKKTRGYNEYTLQEKSAALGLDGWNLSRGASLNNLARLMNDEGIKNWGYRYMNPEAVWTVMDSHVAKGRPVILTVVWEDGTTHAILAAKARKGKVVIYDPGCGVVETKFDKMPGYTAKYRGKKASGFMTGEFIAVQ
jgi:hypothetical protein